MKTKKIEKNKRNWFFFSLTSSWTERIHLENVCLSCSTFKNIHKALSILYIYFFVGAKAPRFVLVRTEWLWFRLKDTLVCGCVFFFAGYALAMEGFRSWPKAKSTFWRRQVSIHEIHIVHTTISVWCKIEFCWRMADGFTNIRAQPLFVCGQWSVFAFPILIAFFLIDGFCFAGVRVRPHSLQHLNLMFSVFSFRFFFTSLSQHSRWTYNELQYPCEYPG